MYWLQIRNAQKVRIGDVFIGRHEKREMPPLDYLEINYDFVFSLREVIERLLDCGPEPMIVSLTHHLCCEAVEQGPETELVEDALQWDPEADPYVLRIGDLSFSEPEFSRLIGLLQRIILIWRPTVDGGIGFTQQERSRLGRLRELIV